MQSPVREVLLLAAALGVVACGSADSKVTPMGTGGTTCTTGAMSTGGATSDASTVCSGVDMNSDPANCGACGNVCATVALSFPEVVGAAIAADATSVYISGWGGSTGRGGVSGPVVMKVPLAPTGTALPDGGRVTPDPITLASGPADSQRGGIAVDSTNVYWTTFSNPGSPAAVMKVSLGGGTPVRLASSDVIPVEIAVTATSIYWGGAVDVLGPGAVMKVPLGGGTPTKVADTAGPPSIAVDATNLYWTDRTDGASVMKMPLAGGTPTTLASGQTPSAIAVDASHVYWTSFGNACSQGAVMKVPLGGGTPTMLASTPEPYAIAVDATSVYWMDSVLGSVMRVPIGGGDPVTLASDQGPRLGSKNAITAGPAGVFYAAKGHTAPATGVMRLGTCQSGVCE